MRGAPRLALALLVALAPLLQGCGGEGAGEAGGAARVVGTAVDGANGELLAGVRVQGPRGAHAVSDREGRFALEGLRAGDQGEVVGTLEDGRIGRVRLRPLAPGRLEIVLRLERP
jgi:hypothetical protein